MRLPEGLENRPFTEWNFLVRGVAEAWEVAQLTGTEAALETRLAQDTDGSFVEKLARLGNQSHPVARLFALRRAIDAGIDRIDRVAFSRGKETIPSEPVYARVFDIPERASRMN